MFRTMIVLLLLFAAATSFAGTLQKQRIEVISHSKDEVGKELVYFVKQEIMKSESMRLTSDNKVRAQIRIETLDPDPNGSAYSTMYSAVIDWINPSIPFPFLLDQDVGHCGQERVKECAQSIVIAASNDLDNLRTIFHNFADKGK